LAKITPSALITEIKGKWNGTCFQMWKGIITGRRNPVHRKITSIARSNLKAALSDFSGCFYLMTVEQRIAWRAYAALLPQSMTGYNAFISRVSALELAGHPDLCVYFDAPVIYSPPISAAPIGLCYYPVSASYCLSWTDPTCQSVYVQGFLSVQTKFSNEKNCAWKMFETVPSANLHMIFDASSFPSDTMIRFTARSINMRGEISLKAEAKPPPPLPSSITILYPNGSEVLYSGRTYVITWRCKTVLNVKIEYSVDNGANYIIINDSVDALSGRINWVAPNFESPICLIKITDIDNPLIFDTSDSVFSIVTLPTISLTAPSGSESWYIGSKYNITWSQTNVPTVRLFYSINSGSDWIQIIASTPGAAGTYEWTIPDNASVLCKVKAEYSIDPLINSISTGLFIILESTVITDIAFGTVDLFNDAVTSYLVSVAMSDSKYIICFRDGGDSDYPKGVVATVAANRSSFGAEATALPGLGSPFAIAKLSDTEIVLMFRSGTTASNFSFRAVVGSYSDTTLSWESYNTLDVNGVYNPSGCGQTSTRFLCFFRDYYDSNKGIAAVGKISAGVITWGAKYEFSATTVSTSAAARMDDTHAVLVFRDANDLNHAKALLVTRTDEVLAFGAISEFNAGDTTVFSLEFFSATQFVVCYCDASDSNIGKMKIGTVTGTDITFGDEYSFSTGAANAFNLKLIDTNTLILSCCEDISSGWVKILTVSGAVLSISNAFVFKSDYMWDNPVAILSTSQFSVSTRDINDTNKGKTYIGYSI